MMKGFMSEDSLKQMSPTSMGLPGKPVKIGDTWPVKTENRFGANGQDGPKSELHLHGMGTA